MWDVPADGEPRGQAMTRAWRWIGVSLALLPLAAGAAEWPSTGQNLANTRHQPAESRIAPDTAGRLGVKWVARLGGNISATPALDRDSLYIVDSAGKLYRIDGFENVTIVRSEPLTVRGWLELDTIHVSEPES